MTGQKRIMIKIAYYYYKLGMTQEQIAKRLSMSRQKVNRLTNRLVDEGIIQITINGYEDYYVDLENELERKFNIKEAVIVPNSDSKEDLLQKLGIVGANYLENMIKSDTTIGVSWGKTISYVIKNISKTNKKNISVIQLVGGINLDDVSVKADEIARTMAESLGGVPYLLYAPAVVKNSDVRDSIMSDQSIKKVFNFMEKCDIALVGIGSLTKESTLFSQKYLTLDDLSELKKTGCVGDICLRYYDAHGKIIANKINSKVVGIDIEDLKKIETVIGVAAGEEKIDPILGALRGKLVDVLITDNITAAKVLESNDRR